MAKQFTSLVVTLLAAFSMATAEWVSDIGESSPEKGQKALAARAEKFWQTMLKAAEEVNLNEYEDMLSAAEKTLAELPAENAEVRRLLQDGTTRLKRTSQALFLNAIAAGETAGEKLSKGFMAPRQSELAISALGDVFGQAIRRFAAAETASGGKAFNDEALREVAERQGEILPVLRQTADLSRDILEDCRVAKNDAYDALKYDIYTKDAPKTPQAAADLADKLIGAAKFMRHKFSDLAMGEVKALVQDTESQHDSAAKVLTRSKRADPGSELAANLPVLSV